MWGEVIGTLATIVQTFVSLPKLLESRETGCQRLYTFYDSVRNLRDRGKGLLYFAQQEKHTRNHEANLKNQLHRFALALKRAETEFLHTYRALAMFVRDEPAFEELGRLIAGKGEGLAVWGAAIGVLEFHSGRSRGASRGPRFYSERVERQSKIWLAELSSLELLMEEGQETQQQLVEVVDELGDFIRRNCEMNDLLV